MKVLSRGGQDLGAVSRHLDYLRLRDDGELELETDDGQLLAGRTISKDLLEETGIWISRSIAVSRILTLVAAGRRS